MRFAEAMSARTDDELRAIVRGPADDWEADAVEAAKAELAKRGIAFTPRPKSPPRRDVEAPEFPAVFDPSFRPPTERSQTSDDVETKTSAPPVCPYCRTAMRPGKLEVHGGHYTDVTYFRANEDGKKEDILEQTTREAFQCGDCATLIIKGRMAGDG